MRQKVQVKGMTCNSCVAKVKQLISDIDHIQDVEVSLEHGEAHFTSAKQIQIDDLNKVLPDKYSILAIEGVIGNDVHSAVNERSQLETYKPILLIFTYVFIISIIIGFNSDANKLMAGMNTFMAGFFLVFSFFKMLDLSGFANSYMMYDVVAKKWATWGYVYPFLEFALGISFVINCCPFITNWITLIVMALSLIGVLQSVLNKRKIKCVCLGTVFNLPMSTVTIIEDSLMIVMSVAMLYFIH